MTDQPTKKSQLRRSLDDEVIPHHQQWLFDYPGNVAAQNEYQRPTRTRPEIPPIRPPMSALPAHCSIKVDGARVGPAPPEWSTPKHSHVQSIPSPPMTEAEVREQRRQRKAKQLADVQARTEARRLRDEEKAAAAPHVPTMSEASQRYFMKLLNKRGARV